MKLSEAVAAVPAATGSHLSAAVELGADLDAPPSVQLVVERRLHLRPMPGVVIHRADLASGERIMHNGLPLTSGLRTARDCGSLADTVVAVMVLDALLRLGKVNVRDLVALAAGARGPGSARFRAAVDSCGASGSGLETRVRLLFAAVGITLVPQFRLAGWGHPFDFAIPWAHLLIEVDGFAFHHTRADLVRDAGHVNEAALAGWTLLRFTWEDVMLHPERMIETVRAALAAAR